MVETLQVCSIHDNSPCNRLPVKQELRLTDQSLVDL
jgi:hypothetical protein